MHGECEIREVDGLTGMDPFPYLLKVELSKLVDYPNVLIRERTKIHFILTKGDDCIVLFMRLFSHEPTHY